MLGRRANKHRWADSPEILTSIKGPWQKFKKADWNFARYEEAILKRPCDPEEVIYCVIDFCIALHSLNDWASKAVKKASRSPNDSKAHFSFSDFEHLLKEEIRWQPAIKAIADTAKHGEYRDTGWPNGVLQVAPFYPDSLMQAFDACEDGMETFQLIHEHRDVVWWDVALRQVGDQTAVRGYTAFGDALDAWKSILENVGLKEN